MKSFIWTDEAVVALKTLLAEGLTARQIGNELGCSRNAVIGKARRINGVFERAPGSANGEPKQSKPKVRRIRPRAPTVVKKPHHHPFRVPPPIAAEKPAERPSVAPGNTKEFLELRAGECHWPFGDGPCRFCAQPALKDRSYCAHHCAMAYVPTVGLLRRRQDYEVAA